MQTDGTLIPMATPHGPDSHRVYEEMAVAHVLGGLGPDEVRRFRAHLLECGECRASVGELRAIAHELAGVELDEQRERAAQAVELAEREASDDDPGIDEVRTWRRFRLFGVAMVLVLVVLSAYTFTLRASYQQLGESYQERLEAASALEHGRDLAVLQQGDGLTATARRSEDRVALLIEGLDDAQSYGLYLTRAAGDRQVTVNRTVQRTVEGRLFVTARLEGSEEELQVTRLDDDFPSEVAGRTVFHATIPPADPSD